MLRIGFDIDGVIAGNSIALWMDGIRKIYPEFKVIVPNQYSIENITGVNKDTLIDIFNDTILNGNIQPYEECSRILQDLWIKGDKIFIITARNSKLRKVTKKWLYEHNIIYDTLMFANMIDKESYADELNLDIVIDDNIQEYVNYSRQGVTKILYSQPWNKNYNLDNQFVIVNNWGELYQEIENVRTIKTIMTNIEQ